MSTVETMTDKARIHEAVALLEKVIAILADKAELATDSDQWPDARFPDDEPYFRDEDISTIKRAERFIRAIHPADPALSVGTRVRLTADVERFPNGIARTGAVGTVTTIAGTVGGLEGVTLEDPPDWLSEWDGELQWCDAINSGPMADQVAPVSDKPGEDA